MSSPTSSKARFICLAETSLSAITLKIDGASALRGDTLAFADSVKPNTSTTA